MLFFQSHGFRVIAHDRRGHGRSSQVGSGHDMDHYADDLAALTAHLDSRTPCMSAIPPAAARSCTTLPAMAKAAWQKRRSSAPCLADGEDRANPGGLPKDVFDGLRRSSQPTGRNSITTCRRTVLWLQPARRESVPGRHLELVAPGHDGGAKAHYDGIVAFSQTDFTED